MEDTLRPIEARWCKLPGCGRSFITPRDSEMNYCSVRCRNRARAQREASDTMYKKGIYRGEAYDSALELAHMQALDAQHIGWTKRHGFRIPYYNVKRRRDAFYLPDFYLPDFALVQEVKAANLVTDAVVQDKAKAARLWCSERGYQYEIVTIAGHVGVL